jgi:hypothetical protein
VPREWGRRIGEPAQPGEHDQDAEESRQEIRPCDDVADQCQEQSIKHKPDAIDLVGGVEERHRQSARLGGWEDTHEPVAAYDEHRAELVGTGGSLHSKPEQAEQHGEQREAAGHVPEQPVQEGRHHDIAGDRDKAERETYLEPGLVR